VSRFQNQNMQWDGNNTLHDNWGNAPTGVQPLNLQVSLKLAADSIRVYPLDAIGAARDSFTIKPESDGRFKVTIDQNELETLWFGIRSFPATVAAPTIEFENLKIYPNPAQTLLNISGDLVDCDITLRNLLGQAIRKYTRVNSSLTVEVTDLTKGLYFVEISDLSGAKRSLRSFIKT
ncbi:MAG: T9SS type A sorting domain-containing protein, partial [Saprospiraceae bacterium]|nr:T9SS type A sorting domain-containing protein [Saprospiraceae bacterium]